MSGVPKSQESRVKPSSRAQAEGSQEPDAIKLLNTPVARVRNVGRERAELLAKLGVHNVADLLFFFPRDYQDLSDRREIVDLEEDKLQSVRGVVAEIDARTTRGGRNVVGVLVKDETSHLRAMWFNQAFMREKFAIGQHVMLSAKPRLRGGVWEMAHPRVTWLEDEKDEPNTGLVAIYSLTEGLAQYQVRQMVAVALQDYGHMLEEVFPETLLEKYQLMPLAEALPAIHRPQDAEQLAWARRRFIFQELFVLQLAMAARRWQHRLGFKAPELAVTPQIDARIVRRFPFELTPGQRAAVDQIAADMGRDVPMNRLLQGDVGSGKTIVAVYAMMLCVARGAQSVLMAPTEILARQHAATLAGLLQASRVRWRLATGGMPAAERREVLESVAAGEVDVVIGTHAVIQDDFEFKRLGLVVIDEQHKFGVRQRAALRRDHQSPHYLVMTATPIPRTVTMGLFGDLDVTTLRDMPPGRQEVRTYLVEAENQPRWWHFVRNKLSEGRQAYVVVPLVEESPHFGGASVAEAFERLTNGELEAFHIGLIHGRLSSTEKDEAMEAFRRGETQVLVSTTVIEVGVDVPNATIMVVDSPSRFGLAQLHQLRGRVGRGTFQGTCGLLVGEDVSQAARERLEQFAALNDGFALAELDLKLRGPGDLFGTQQHGVPPLRIADLLRDAEVLEESRREAQELFASDPGLAQPEHARLRRQMLVRYGQALELSDVG